MVPLNQTNEKKILNYLTEDLAVVTCETDIGEGQDDEKVAGKPDKACMMGLHNPDRRWR